MSENAPQGAGTPSAGGRLPRLIRTLASMPVAVGLLSLLALTSMIGTVVVQNGDPDFYLSTLGPDWYRLLKAIGLLDMYSAWWFVTILALLVLSVSAALLRHGPRFWHQARPLQAMRPWPARCDGGLAIEGAQPFDLARLQTVLQRHGYGEFLQGEEQGRPVLLARKGRLSKYGFFFVHGGVVLICIGALITSQLGFRGVMNINEGESDDIVYVRDGDTYHRLLLPFQVRNDKFTISFYQSGMPSDYSSDLQLLRDDTPLTTKRITVNDPLRFQGLTFYQASFGDGGSRVNFTLTDLTREGFPRQSVSTEVGKVLEDGSGLKITVKELRQHNVMNFSEDPQRKELRDMGPSLDLAISSPASGNITYRAYLAYPNVLAFARLGEEAMIYDNLGIPLGDEAQMALLAGYLKRLSAIDGEVGPDERRAAFAAAMHDEGIPLAQAAELGPAIAIAARALQGHKLPILFSFDSFVPKMYTGLQVARDPGSPLVWTASALLVLGLVMMIYLHERRLWLRLDESGNRLELCALISGRHKHPLRQELARLEAALGALATDNQERS